MTIKKIILIVVAIVATHQLNAQARFGSNVADVLSDFTPADHTITYDEDGDKILTFENYEGDTYQYRFNSEEKCWLFVLIPKTKGKVHGYIERFNKMFVIVDRKTWYNYLDNGGVIKITLNNSEEGTMYFIYSIEKD